MSLRLATATEILFDLNIEFVKVFTSFLNTLY